jgi:hypothetical protein
MHPSAALTFALALPPIAGCAAAWLSASLDDDKALRWLAHHRDEAPETAVSTRKHGAAGRAARGATSTLPTAGPAVIRQVLAVIPTNPARGSGGPPSAPSSGRSFYHEDFRDRDPAHDKSICRSGGSKP